MVLDFILFLSFFFLFSLHTSRFLPLLRSFISAFMYLSMSLFYIHISIYLYASTFLFLHVRTFKIYFLLRNLSTCAPCLHFFSIHYIYQLIHVTSPCLLALLVYRFVKTLQRIAVVSFFLFTFAFLTSSLTAFPSERKKISFAI